MLNNSEEMEKKLFLGKNSDTYQTPDKYQEHLIEQYKVYLESFRESIYVLVRDYAEEHLLK